MKVTISEDEVKKLIAEHVEKRLGIPIKKSEVVFNNDIDGPYGTFAEVMIPKKFTE